MKKGRSEINLERHDAALEAVSFATEQFLKMPTWEQNIQAVLERLGQAVKVSRIHIFQNHVGTDHALSSSQLYEWSAPGVAPQIDNLALQRLPYREGGLGRWEASLSQGQIIAGRLQDLPESERRVLAAQDVCAILVAPIFVGSEWWGFISLEECAAERQWSVAEQDALKTIADILGATIQREQRELEIRRRLREMAMFNHIIAAATSTRDERTVLQIACQELAHALDSPHCLVTLLSQDGSQETVVAEYRLAGRISMMGAAIPLTDDAAAEYVIRHKTPLAIPNTAVGPYASDVYGGLFQRAAAAVLIVPLLPRGQVIGVISVGHLHVTKFSEEDITLARSVAAATGQAWENIRLYNEAYHRARYLATLNEIGQAVTSTLDLDRVVATLLEHVRQATDAAACSVALVEPVSGDLVFHQAAGIGSEKVIGLRLRPNQGIAGWVMAHHQPVLVLDAASDPRFFSQMDKTTGFITHDLICVPLIARDVVIGVIELLNKRSGVFGESDIRLLESVAAQAAIAIENARLFQAERQQRELAETLRQIGETLVSTLDMDTVLDRLLEQVERVVPNDAANVMLLEGEYVRMARWRNYERFGVQDFVSSIRFRVSATANYRHMLATGQPMVIPNTADYAGWIRIAPMEWIRSYASSPIYSRGEIIGFLNVDSATPGFFNQSHADRLRAFADQAGVAIQNAHLFKESQRRVSELAIVSNVALDGAAGRPLDEIVTRATVMLSQLWPTAKLGFLFVDEADQSLRMHPSYHGVPREYAASLRVPSGQGITGWAVREKQPVLVGDVTTDARYWPGPAGMRSEMTAPLIVGGRAIGVVNVEAPQLDAFSADDLRLLTTLAGQLATIFEKARLDAKLAEYAEALERRVAERTAEIRSQQARTQAILDALGEGVVVTDLHGTILYLNPTAEVLTGYSAREALGRNPRLWKSDQTPAAVYEDMWRTILNGETWRGEIVNRRKDGALYDASLTIAPILSGDNRLSGFVGVQHDISRLKELDRLKSEFVSNVSHELRTPLSNIKLYLGLLERGRPEQRAQYVEVLKREELRLEYLIEDLLTLSRIDLVKIDMQLEPLDMDILARQLVADRQALALSKELTLAYHVQPAPLPAVLADAAMISQVLTNLMSNAMNYTPAGETITVRVEQQDAWLTISVQDTGVGISDQDRAHLFERFYRGQAARQTGAPGTGLGLAICQEIVRRHNGKITVESALGKGSTFTVWLPVA